MPECEGFVASLKEAGKAEVIVQPETLGIVGAPGFSKKVCHCASSSSQVTMEALNPLQACVGDRVSVRFDPSLLPTAIIGAPMLGLVFGSALSAFIADSTVFHIPVKFISVFAGLSLGGVVGALIYRRLPKGNALSIIRITRTKAGGTDAQ